MAVLMTPPYLQFFDSNGDVLAGGKVYTYTATGTFSTLKATYTSEAATTEHPNPVILDASGIPETGNGSIWLDGTYDFKVTDADDVTVETTLNVTAFTTTGASGNAYFESFSGDGAETEFTTSTDLGTEEKAIFVWVDAGGGKGYDLVDPSDYTIDGTTLTFDTAPASGTNNIYVSAPSTLVGAASAAAADAEASAAAALASETQAGVYAGQLTITSTTSVAIGTGSKVFTVSSGLSLNAGQFILITSDANPDTNYMWGQIASYSGTTLTVTVAAIGGSGTLNDWTMYLTGERGATGATGSISDISGVSSGTPANNDTFIFTDIDDSNTTKKVALSEFRGSLVLLSEQTASASVTVDFESLIDSTYKTYIIEIADLIPATDDVTLNMVISENDGSSYIGANYDYTYARQQSSTITAESNTAQVAWILNNNATVGSAATEGLSATIKLDSPSNTSRYKTIGWNVRNIDPGGVLEVIDGVGMYDGTPAAYNAVRLLMSSGNIASGTFKLYGVR